MIRVFYCLLTDSFFYCLLTDWGLLGDRTKRVTSATLLYGAWGLAFPRKNQEVHVRRSIQPAYSKGQTYCTLESAVFLADFENIPFSCEWSWCSLFLIYRRVHQVKSQESLPLGSARGTADDWISIVIVKLSLFRREAACQLERPKALWLSPLSLKVSLKSEHR